MFKALLAADNLNMADADSQIQDENSVNVQRLTKELDTWLQRKKSMSYQMGTSSTGIFDIFLWQNNRDRNPKVLNSERCLPESKTCIMRQENVC